MKAIWNGTVVAESSEVIQFDNNPYFPIESIKKEFFKPSSHTSVCPWKGTAKYYDVVVDGKNNENSAWYYPDPSSKAQPIKGRIAFWKGVTVTP